MSKSALTALLALKTDVKLTREQAAEISNLIEQLQHKCASNKSKANAYDRIAEALYQNPLVEEVKQEHWRDGNQSSASILIEAFERVYEELEESKKVVARLLNFDMTPKEHFHMVHSERYQKEANHIKRQVYAEAYVSAMVSHADESGVAGEFEEIAERLAHIKYPTERCDG